MATQPEYALMAGAAYISTRADINQIPAPQGWTPMRHETQSSGFEAISFQRGNEIVIAFAGTNPNSLLDPDNAANIGLATGFGSDQLLQAAEYYLQVKAANQNANITFTGHSLGGGLAALIGVFFGKQAVTFDQAPFANSAELNLLTPDVAANLKTYLSTRLDSSGNRIYADVALAGLTNFLQLRETNGGIPNSDKITNIRVDGEFVQSAPLSAFDTIGNAPTVLTHGPYSSPSIDMHSQALLTAFLQSNQSAASSNNPQQTLSEVTKKLTNLLGMFFDSALFSNLTDTDKRNLLEHLVRHQAGVGTTIAADDMLKHFTNDMQDIVTAGGKAQDQYNNLNKALIAFGIQAYYEQTNAFTKEAFESFGGGVRFDRAMIAGDLNALKGYGLYFHAYLQGRFYNDLLNVIETQLPSLQDWFIGTGANVTSATADTRPAFLLGDAEVDGLAGGTGAELLVGNGGHDWMFRAANDTSYGNSSERKVA